MELYVGERAFIYECENIARMFFRDVNVLVEDRCAQTDRTGDWACAERRTDGSGALALVASAAVMGKTERIQHSADGHMSDKECVFILARLLFDILVSLTGNSPEWGVITGIRPAKFAREMLGEIPPDEVVSRLRRDYRVSERKAQLCVETALVSKETEQLSDARSFSLYVSIPFCPSRCSYCSFVSKTIEREGALVEPYVEKLCEELALCGKIVRSLDLRLESAYIGGGTPTTLSASQLERLCGAISANFDLENAREFSVEAGRPDTITRAKLIVLKKSGVTRLSINPQTASDAVLREIGRRHTAADIERAFAQSRELGFDNINADLIAGLPTDDLPGFEKTLHWIEALRPESITVHALTRKRSSKIAEAHIEGSNNAGEMVSLAGDELPRLGYLPYYMYKQKGAVDSLENTGYALSGKRCLYNIYIMEELHTIVACGAGAVTKLVDLPNGRITRIYNYKYPAEYLTTFDEQLRRKKGITQFYDSQSKQ
ncbi:MAG: coproporphyrinogen dehydrogenase HemZ [Oscillospiraceae bacterium]